MISCHGACLQLSGAGRHAEQGRTRVDPIHVAELCTCVLRAAKLLQRYCDGLRRSPEASDWS